MKIPNEKEIERAMEILKKCTLKPGYVLGNEGEQIEKILYLAEAYLSMKEWPEKIDITKHKEYPTRKEMTEQGFDYGFNEALELCRLARLKQTEKLRDALKIGIEWMEYWLNQDECDCGEHHICGKPQREEELKFMKKVLKKELN